MAWGARAQERTPARYLHAMNTTEKQAVVGVCMLAAFVDGAKVEREREELRRIVDGLAGADTSLAASAQDVLVGRVTLAQLAAELRSVESKNLAYEMALCVCDADGARNDAERAFLAELRRELGLPEEALASLDARADDLTSNPFAAATAVDTAEIDSTILKNAILCAALEQLPQRMASLAIVPLQMRLVYKVGASYGFKLDKGHVLDLLGAAGVGVASQMVDSFARELVTRFAGRLVGSFLSGLAGRATSSAVAFGTTYALGHLAKRYYSGGRKLTTEQLRDTFRSLVDQARGIESKYAGQISERARNVDVGQLASLVRGA
jgi:uncharacterized protein (DUF697 family)/tellurite resistance protein